MGELRSDTKNGENCSRMTLPNSVLEVY